MKKTDLQKLSSHLQSVFGSKNWQSLWETHKLVQQWPEVAGRTIASRSAPAYVRKNILWIYVHDSVWMQQLQALKPQLLDKVRNFSAALPVQDIRWLLQPADHDKKEAVTGTPVKKPVINPAEQKDFEKIAGTVENEQCRAALCRLWEVYHKN
jgi:hypothetical protein